MLNISQPFSEIKEAISEARDKAKMLSEKDFPFNRSRGCWLSGVVNGDAIDECESNFQFSTKRDFLKYIGSLKSSGATNIFIEGGFDSADSLQDLNNGDYLPWASCWCIELTD